MTRDDLLKFDGTPRSELEARIRTLVLVLDAAAVLVAADDAAGSATADDEGTADEQYERAWDKLRASITRLTSDSG